ncbi:U11/U12 small nuclear ribonucleoprotein 35 kDa protein-like [Macrosteles quadrilineatus]|uniref:U11/U12 small nuclear ribonucleoprotein 35 kDa protein-like n=1 Tax=Macrosteles quadrilineatus TaxID=74068 RepID=UPI0023E2EAD8|nr:U11/U12 small nuclear ribonucleoprotein 35 kDa protein-like [Macrosteles quadrilineatus]XP_054268980.1 U11/U12 small nuclear ribonucleoprotein 35 kDa protein-like [Macrosteles quadrilineatus]XP_054268981.1 U11/U12 small nuclear ribonucleoprotein 35 kDa protein-like [Macrosteles quadrilineatus]
MAKEHHHDVEHNDSLYGDDFQQGVDIKEQDKKILSKFFSSQALIYDPLKAGSIDGTDVVAHDRAVSRALASNYHPPPTTNNPQNTVFVARLNRKTTEQKLLKVFSEFGKVKSCKLIRCLVTGESKRYAFVEYEERGGAMAAYRRGHKMRLDDAMLVVDFECEHLLPCWVPRRLGGGLGGKKESGQLRFGSRDRPYRKPIPLMTHSSRMDVNVNLS